MTSTAGLQIRNPLSDAISLTANGMALRSSLLAGSHVEGDCEESLRLSFDQPAGRGTVEFFEFDPDFSIIVSNCFWQQDGFVKYAGEGWVRLNFCLDACAAFEFDELGRFELRGQELRVFYQPDGVDCGHYIQGNARSVCITISIQRDYLRKITGALGDRFLNSAGQGGSDGFFFLRSEMGGDSLRAVADMLSMRYSGSLRTLYAKAKSEELLVSALSAPQRPEIDSGQVRLGRQDRERIAQAREILERQFARPPSVSELSRRIAVNRNKLSYGFRDMHGCSMSEYVAERRLETAWRLLKDTDQPISQIAEDVGYSHLPSFSAAFKRRYGVSARAFRRSLASET